MGSCNDCIDAVVNAFNLERSGNVRFPLRLGSWNGAPRGLLTRAVLKGVLRDNVQAYVEAKLTKTDNSHSCRRTSARHERREWVRRDRHLEPNQTFERDWLRPIDDAPDARQ
jgi:hypothetical protein